MTSETSRQNEEAAIKRIIEDGIEALRSKNLAGVMALYAPEVVSFDIVPPLRYRGAEAFSTVWEEVFSLFQGPIEYEMHDLSITVGADVAFAYSLNHLSGTLTTGQQTALWLRWTACWRKINGRWLIVHHQNSVPVDLVHGKALLDLVP